MKSRRLEPDENRKEGEQMEARKRGTETEGDEESERKRKRKGCWGREVKHNSIGGGKTNWCRACQLSLHFLVRHTCWSKSYLNLRSPLVILSIDNLISTLKTLW